MPSGQAFKRSDRIRKAMMREISDIIANEVKDPALLDQVISVTDVELSPDMSHAKVFLSIWGDEELQAELMEILVAAAPKMRQLIGQRIRLRHTPEIHLKLDDSLERGSRMTTLLDKIARGEDA